jgi:predicted RecB family nuclease
MTDTAITGSMLYDLEMCEHRPWMDLHADPGVRDPASAFVQMLWRRGRAHEEKVIAGEGVGELLNLRVEPPDRRERLTLEAVANRAPLIYGGRITANNLVGEPDLLRFEGSGYIPGDIKSGAGEEGHDEDARLKVHYGVQLALYVDILERLGFSAGRRAFVWDVHGQEVPYDLTTRRGPRSPTLWESYEADLSIANAIIANSRPSLPAYASGTCKQCWWLTACLTQLENANDLTLIPELGRSKRDPLSAYAATIADFAAVPLESLTSDKGKSIVRGFSPETLAKFQSRAVLQTSGGAPYLKSAPVLPRRAVELFFDIETDPSRDHCYLHGFLERRDRDNTSEQFFGFFSAEATPNGERNAFAQAWEYLKSRRPCAVFIYSKYERTWWRSLQKRHPDVCTADEIEELFASPDMVDLYEIVSHHTDWPTYDYSLKTLARFLGFSWRDAHPSGAESIEWFERYILGDPDARARILAYNEDDCRATRVLLDGISGLLPAKPGLAPSPPVAENAVDGK